MEDALSKEVKGLALLRMPWIEMNTSSAGQLRVNRLGFR